MSTPAIFLWRGWGEGANVLSCHFSWEGKCSGGLLSVHQPMLLPKTSEIGAKLLSV